MTAIPCKLKGKSAAYATDTDHSNAQRFGREGGSRSFVHIFILSCRITTSSRQGNHLFSAHIAVHNEMYRRAPNTTIIEKTLAWPEHTLRHRARRNKNGEGMVMLPPTVAHIGLPLIVGISIALMLIRPRDIPEVWWISGGALLLVALRLVPLKLAGQAVLKGSDVYLFLLGMMLLSELAREQGVFDWVASIAVRGARGSCSRLFLLVYGVGTLVTIFMSNDATAVVLTPAILTAVRKARVAPLPYLFVCAVIANAASFVLPISNPANLVVFHTGMPPLGRWLADFGIPSLLSIVVTFLVMRFLFREELRTSIESEVEEAELSANGRLVLAGTALMVAVLLVASALKRDLGLPTCLAALLITAVV